MKGVPKVMKGVPKVMKGVPKVMKGAPNPPHLYTLLTIFIITLFNLYAYSDLLLRKMVRLLKSNQP